MILRTLKRMWEDAIRLTPTIVKIVTRGALIAAVAFLPIWGLIGLLTPHWEPKQIGSAVILLAMFEGLLATWFALAWNTLKYEDACEETHRRIYGDKNE